MLERETKEKTDRVSGYWGEWCVSDRGDAVGWAAAFIWGALILLAEVTGFADDISWWDGWGVFFAGAAAIVLVGTAIRWMVPEFRRAGLEWGVVFGLILLGVGLGDMVAWIWPVLLGGAGVAILYSVLSGRR